ncbi:CubicO group peptidase (beta-lactamase class C family) [Povalibacter uvarum]|uniref:CubicO group peptidase (Beta-lactamase class C family) n=1 Tax=Povalibacter uvarum TaxID=732238 RepID=A0A841HU15_9GAMM|nr:serine hydrolase [Povalibacter uvarum]MBB6096293.1 CubicO group peptidase (beta-lactamase class C family) [Povalibacter uvarum]
MKFSLPLAACALMLSALLTTFHDDARAAQPASAVYYPPAGSWAKKSASELGMDQAALDSAVAFAKTRESTREMDFSDQERIFGSMLGSVPDIRARTNGIVIYKGYVVAEFGDTTWVDPTYSAAKSMMSTVAAIGVRDGRISSLDEPVGKTVKDGGYDSAHNALVTWKMHLQQESEWQGTMFGKKDDFIGKAAFGEGERKPREIRPPGTFYEYNDVRINRFGLSLLRTFKQSVPTVFRREVMDPIGASNTWRWIPYHNSFVEIDGRQLASVSGGTRWGGGVWINAQDMARFGYLWLRGGKWDEKQIVPSAFVKAALTPSDHGPDYGYLWWLNTQGKNYPDLPTTAYGARGAGSNTITILPEQDLVVVWRWHSGNEAEFVKRVVAAIKP